MQDFFSAVSVNTEEFTQAIMGMFTFYGYEVKRRARGLSFHTAHYHLLVTKNHKISIVRCKCWSPMRLIDLSDVTSFSYVMEDDGADAGFYITLGEFDEDAIAYAREHQIVPVNRSELFAMLRGTGQIPKRQEPVFKQI